MEKQYVLSFDQGTTSCRAIVFDRLGHIVKVAQQEFKQYYPHSGWVEQDAQEIWEVQLLVTRQATQGIDPRQIAAIGVTNQRETTVVWDRVTGKPLHPAIVWQCRRSTSICEALQAAGMGEQIRDKTGLILDPYFSGTKLKWLLDEHPAIRQKAQRGEVLFGTIDSWLIWNLTEGRIHATDYSNASRTMLFNIYTLEWDDDILREFGIPRTMLPEVKPSSCFYGYTTIWTAELQIPITGVAGDQQAALFGNACYKQGMAKNTYGTGCFILKNTGETPISSDNGLLTTIAWGIEGKVNYALEGSVFVAGAVIQWLHDGLGLIESAAETEALAMSVHDTEGVYFVPAFTGLGAPHWNPHARGMIMGMHRGTNKAHLVRAALEAIVYQSMDILKMMEQESQIQLHGLKVDGGALKNNFLLQFQADMLNVPVIRPKVEESTALGAAYLAGLAVGFWKNIAEIEQLWELDRTFMPEKSDAYRIEKYTGWNKAISMLV
jgi:glycerol kinase